jgi:hypothetical protein
MWLAPTDADLLDPRSRHNRHVRDRDDLAPAAGRSRDALYRAVAFVDDRGEDEVVVVDYGRASLYATPGTALSYDPPGLAGLGSAPTLYVREPAGIDLDGPDGPRATPVEGPLAVSPAFEILVPAFDWEAVDADDGPPRPGRRAPARTGVGTGAGSPG